MWKFGLHQQNYQISHRFKTPHRIQTWKQYDMIWYDMIWYDMMYNIYIYVCDVIWYGMIICLIQLCTAPQIGLRADWLTMPLAGLQYYPEAVLPRISVTGGKLLSNFQASPCNKSTRSRYQSISPEKILKVGYTRFAGLGHSGATPPKQNFKKRTRSAYAKNIQKPW